MKSPDWLRILTASPRQRLPGGVQLRLLTAQEVLEARREATALAGEDRDRALCSNACLVARAVVRRGRPVYGSGEEVLHRLTVGQVETLARRWMAFYQEEVSSAGLAVMSQLTKGEYEEVYDALREDVREQTSADAIEEMMDTAIKCKILLITAEKM